MLAVGRAESLTVVDKRVACHQVDEGRQRLTVSDVTTADAGLYLCQVSLGRADVLRAEAPVVLCRR